MSDFEPCPGSGLEVDAEPGCHVRCPDCGADTLVDGRCGVDGCAWCRDEPMLIDHTREVER